MSTPVFPNSARAIPKTQTEREADQARADAAMPDPPDEPGDEMTYGARVWKTYVRETDQADKELVEGRNNSLDVLLIFAALFSAISSAFVIESLGDLKPDPAESSAQTLLAISRTLAAISNGQPVDPSSLGSVDTPTFSPSRTAVAVNALWFLSLGLSVAVSLIAMLAKEWCYLFLSRRSGPMYEQARRRQERWNGIKRWKMKEVLTYLPGLMHLALLLFAVGLCIYIWDTNVAVAIPFIVVTITASVIYLGTTVVSLFDKFCPYTTPATPLLLVARDKLLLGVELLCSKISYLSRLATTLKKARGGAENGESKFNNPDAANSQVPMDDVTGQMLEWVVKYCEDPRSVDIAVEALAGASTEFLYGPLGESELISSLPKRVSQFLDKCHIGTDNAYVLGDQRRLALVMLYSRINNLLLYEGTYGCITHVIGRWLTLGNDVFRYHIEISGIINEMLFTDTESIKNPNALALVVATAMPSCARIVRGDIPDYERYAAPQQETIKMITNALDDRRSAPWPERMASLLEKHLSSEGSRLSSNALHALVESSIHYLVEVYPWQRGEERETLVPVLLAQLYFALPSSSADLQTIAVALAATDFATYSYPGGEEPSDGIESRRRRALKVIKHYQKNPPDNISTFHLFHFGFVGFLSELKSDDWTKHGNTMGHLLESLDEQFSMRFFDTLEFSIYTLQTSLDRESHRALAACRCLSSLSRSTFTQDAEKAMHIFCLYLTGRSPPSSKQYFAALVALRYAQSSVLRSFCLEIVNSQHAPPPSDVLVHEVSENSVLWHLRHIPPLGIPHFTTIHKAYLVAAILLSTDVPSSGRLAALEPAFGPLDKEPSDGADYSSSLAGAMDQTSGPEALEHIMGCAVSFYYATDTQKAELDAKIVADGDHSHWEAKLRRFRSNCELESWATLSHASHKSQLVIEPQFSSSLILFLSRRSGPMYEQARRRQERWNGIKRWKMKEVLTYLPGLMHLALLLFTVGLCVYLWDTNVAVAIPFIVVTITASVIYLGTTVVSVFDKFCPYATPATPLLHIALHGFFSGVASLLGKKSSPEWLAAITEKTSGGVETENSKSGSHYVADKQVPMDGVTGQMLEWIVTNCEDSRSVDIAVEAFAGASTVSIDRLLVGSKLIRSLPGRVSQFLEKCHIGKDNAYVLNDQRRLALVMLYSRINNLLIYKGIYVNMADVSMTEETIRRDVFRYHYELSDKVNQMLFRDTESINNLSALALVVATSVPSWVYIKSIQAKVHHRGLAFSLLECILGDRRTLSLPVDWPEKMASLLQEHLSSGGPRLSSNALHALVESSIHYLVGLYPWQSAKDRRILVPLSLAQLYFALPLSSAAIPTIAVALAATEFATYPHTGGEEPPNAMGSRRRRALEVIKHYRKDSPDDKSTHDLFHFGFVGFLSELTSDGWTQHADTIQDLLKSLKARFPTPIDSSIYTLPDLNPNSREVLAVRRCLSSLSRSTFTQDAEKAMTTSCLEHILSDRIRGGSSDLKLYSAALVALRYAQSIELQTLCRRVILCQRTPLISDCLPQVVSEQLVLSHLQYVSTSNLSHIGPVAIIHTAVLVAAILLSAYSPFTARRAALETMIEQESSLDQQPVDIANYSSRLSQAIDQTSGPEALRHILQCAAEFYHATAVQRADMDAQIIADGDLFHWNTKLQRFNEQLYRPTGRT